MTQPKHGFLIRMWRKPPVIFPLLAVFHLAITLHACWLYIEGGGFDIISWMHPLSLGCYTVAWFFLCDLRKWAAYVYIGLTSLNLLLQNLTPPFSTAHAFAGSLFPADLIFTFFILVYYKRLG